MILWQWIYSRYSFGVSSGLLTMVLMAQFLLPIGIGAAASNQVASPFIFDGSWGIVQRFSTFKGQGSDPSGQPPRSDEAYTMTFTPLAASTGFYPNSAVFAATWHAASGQTWSGTTVSVFVSPDGLTFSASNTGTGADGLPYRQDFVGHSPNDASHLRFDGTWRDVDGNAGTFTLLPPDVAPPPLRIGSSTPIDTPRPAMQYAHVTLSGRWLFQTDTSHQAAVTPNIDNAPHDLTFSSDAMCNGLWAGDRCFASILTTSGSPSATLHGSVFTSPRGLLVTATQYVGMPDRHGSYARSFTGQARNDASGALVFRGSWSDTYGNTGVFMLTLVEGGDTGLAPVLPTQPNAIHDQYLVELHTPPGSPDADAAVQRTRIRGADVTSVYRTVISGFAATMTPDQLLATRQDPAVAFIEPENYFHTEGSDQTGPGPESWGLDRINQRTLPLDGRQLSSALSGEGVTAYVLDTGIRASHQDFGGRVNGGVSFVGGDTNDCHGHGTHVAGILGGNTFGVAHQVRLVPLKVSTCSVDDNGFGSQKISPQAIINALDWIGAHHTSEPSLVNMSLGRTGADVYTDDAVRGVVNAGVQVIHAVDETGNDACDYSPNVSESISVGATNAADRLMDDSGLTSDTGRCIDLFAPGSGIISAGISSDDSWRQESGTSMASPFAAGTAALYLEVHPHATPAEVKQAIINLSTKNVLDQADIRAGSPNRLLYSVIPGPAPTIASATMSFHTNDEDKDADTEVHVYLFDNTNTQVAHFDVPNDHFDDNSDEGPYSFTLDSHHLTWAQLHGGYIEMESIPHGGIFASHDTWRFNLQLKLTFSSDLTVTIPYDGNETPNSGGTLTWAL